MNHAAWRRAASRVRCAALGVWSDYSLYSEEIATFGESDYNQADAAGFINLYGLPIKVKAMVDAKNKK